MLTDTTCAKLVKEDHPYRKINRVLDLSELEEEFFGLYSEKGANGLPISKGLRALILQFMEDYSDRQMERALQENLAVKFFCGFEIGDVTPDHSYFGKLRKRLGTENVAKIFNFVVEQMSRRGLVGNCFSFVDSTAVITKTALWKERDKAIAQGEEKLNNANVKKYSADRQARWGCKGKNKYWYGYKRHVRVDMKHGVIMKVAMTPANIADGEGLKHVCPKQGMVFADKAYCTKHAQRILKKRNCHSGAILKNNMRGKNFPKDKWLTRTRMPYEGVFSKMPTRARYRTKPKLQLQGFLEAIASNLKRWIILEEQLQQLQPT